MHTTKPVFASNSSAHIFLVEVEATKVNCILIIICIDQKTWHILIITFSFDPFLRMFTLYGF